MDFKDRTWQNTSVWRKRWFVIFWMIMLWPIALIIAITGRIYGRDKTSPNGVKKMWLGMNAAVIVWPVVVLIAVPFVWDSLNGGNPMLETNMIMGNSQAICPDSTDSIVRVIGNISALKLKDITVVDHDTAKTISVDDKTKTERCRINVILSTSQKMTFSVKIQPSPYQKDYLLIKTRQMSSNE